MAAAGDAYIVGPTSVNNGSYLSLQPAAGGEVVIHNIYWSANGVTIEQYDGTNSIVFDSDTTAGARLAMAHHCSNSVYLRIKNNSGGAAIYIGADGIYTHATS